MRRIVVAAAMMAVALSSAPADGQEKKSKQNAPPVIQGKMLEWEWTGDVVQNGATYRKFRAVADGTMDPTKATEVPRAFSDQVTRHEKYTMLSIAQGGTPVMGNWTKQADGTFVREYVFKTGGRKGVELATARTSTVGTVSDSGDTALGKGQLKHIKRGEETAVDALKFNKDTFPGVKVGYTLTYTSPPSEEQIKVDGAWLAVHEWTYKWAPDGEPRYSPWRTMKTIEWKTTADKNTVEIQTFVARRTDVTP